MSSIAIVILTYNEALNIEQCLKRAKALSDTIYIIDSYSTDDTISICEKYGCNVFQNPFVNHAHQLNWALKNIPIENDWILRLDSDEYLMDSLLEEIKEVLPQAKPSVNGFFLRRRVLFMNKWIRFGGYYPTVLLRLWRNGKAVCEERWMDEHMKLLEGESIVLKNDMVDDNSKNLHWWIDKHNDYATKEALEHLNQKHQFLDYEYMTPRFFGTQEQRKRWLKDKVYVIIPLGMRSFIYFIYRYFFRFGFLDGFRGLFFHVLQGFWYRFLVDAKVYEIERKAKKNKLSIKEVIIQEYQLKL